MDLRKCINLLSDVVNNRPMPIRELDQIYMRHADMLLQIEHISKYFSDKSVVFIGDGDAIALGLAYMQFNGEIEGQAKSILVLDFDERIINSINCFAKTHNMSHIISAQLYNVADPLPKELWGKFDCFYCNPPYGASNEGVSITSFMQRGFEATKDNAEGCVVLADVPELTWTGAVLSQTQKYALDNGFIVCEMIPTFHTYHLEDDPGLTSCSIMLRRIVSKTTEYVSEPLNPAALENFYGKNEPLKYKKVRDLTQRKYFQADYELVPIMEDRKNGH